MVKILNIRVEISQKKNIRVKIQIENKCKGSTKKVKNKTIQRTQRNSQTVCKKCLFCFA